MMRFRFVLVAMLAFSGLSDANERVVGGPCEGCEAVFEGRPATLASRTRIAPDGSAGEALTLTGTVRDAQGKAVAGVIVYAYHTDKEGRYPANERVSGRAAKRHGLFRGFAVTDAKGHYAFDTIRPTGYPDSPVPQHIHMHVVEPGRCTYYIDDVVFEDDARLTEAMRRSHLKGRGGFGAIQPRREAGVWLVSRDIELGKGISDYVDCARK
jgi:protocatechuate 3,4-dioxygenase, beta subunit